MNGEYAGSGELPKRNTDKEFRWKLHEEKQKAKQNARMKKLDFARPVSATESWNALGGRGGGGDKARPLSARCWKEGSTPNDRSTIETLTKAQAFAKWRLPSVGEGDGIEKKKEERAERPLTDESASSVMDGVEDIEDIEDVEDVLFADNDNVNQRPESDDRLTLLGDSRTVTPVSCLQSRVATSLSDVDAESCIGGQQESTDVDQEENESRKTGAYYTPLIPIAHDDDDEGKEEEEEIVVSEAILGWPSESSPVTSMRHCSSNNDDDDDSATVREDRNENGEAVAVINDPNHEDETVAVAQNMGIAKGEEEELEKEQDYEAMEREVEEYLLTMKGRQYEFMMQPIPQKLRREFRCRLKRRDDGWYELRAERQSGVDVVLMTAKMRKKTGSTSFVIFQGGEAGGGGCRESAAYELGGVKANLLGTNFTVFRHEYLSHSRRKRGPPEFSSYGIENEVAAITYETNILGMKGPRRVGVVIPGMTPDGSRVTLRTKENNDSILNRLKRNANSHLIRMENKVPTWSEASKSFVLNFSGRVTKASVKNFQIVHERDPDYIVFQFGRVDGEEFTLDFRYPLCPLQAFGCGLSSMSRKLACE